MRLLIADDDERLTGLLEQGFRAEGYSVDRAATAEDAAWLGRAHGYDAMILDVGFPDGDGFSVCAGLRSAKRWTPILMLTARDAVAERVRGLDVGADDYLCKPFAFTELSARVRALVRRGGHERPLTLRVDSLELDRATRRVTVAGVTLALHLREFGLLDLFMRRVDEVLTRTMILENVWDWSYEGTSNLVDVHVAALRRQLGNGPGIPTIETVRGVGYVLHRSGGGSP